MILHGVAGNSSEAAGADEHSGRKMMAFVMRDGILCYRRISREHPLLMDKGHLSMRKKISTNDDKLETPTQVWTTRCNAGAIRRAGRRLLHMYDTIIAPTGLKQCQYGILSALKQKRCGVAECAGVGGGVGTGSIDIRAKFAASEGGGHYCDSV